MCIAITLEKATVDIVISALIAKMGDMNTSAILNGEKDEEEYDKYEKALDLFSKAKESLYQ